MNFSGNKITKVGFGLLDHVNSLSNVFLLNNSCINLEYDSSSMHSLSYLKLQLAVKCSFEVVEFIESTFINLPSSKSVQGSIKNNSIAVKKLNDRSDETILRIIQLEDRLRALECRLNETMIFSMNIFRFDERITRLENLYIESALYLKYLMNRP